MLCSLSTRLGETEIHEIAALEKEFGHPLLAFSCHKIDPAKVDDQELKRIQELETKLGVSLVAVSG
ncbi:MAG: hypothetical protein JW990_01330 [Thermoleophilia bacterium]|nr:hypothetical protein [Thermoleophilia bacterium]